MTAAHYKGGHHPGNGLGLHYTALPPIVASCPYSDQLLVTRKFWSPGANRPSQVSERAARFVVLRRSCPRRAPPPERVEPGVYDGAECTIRRVGSGEALDQAAVHFLRA